MAQQFWFFSIVILGLAFVFVLPPFQGADEHKHWVRAWSVAEGHPGCGKVSQAAIDARRAFHYRHRKIKLKLARFKTALQQDVTQAMSRKYTRAACRYPPYPYVLTAIVLRTFVYFNGSIDKGDMIKAHYIGRVFNWLCMCLAVYWFMWMMPRFRNVTLFFFSIPEVHEQTGQFNTELAQFALMFLLIAMVLRAPTFRPQTMKTVVAIGIIATLMALIKPVFGLYGLLALPTLASLYTHEGGKKSRYRIAALALLFGPLILWKLWMLTTPRFTHYPEGVDPGGQIAFLVQHPLHIFTVMWNQITTSTFGHNLMRGSWTSILGGFGPARIELPMKACYLLLGGLSLATIADLTYPKPPTTLRLRPPRILERFSWALASVGVFLAIPASVFAMYLYYTPVGNDTAYGVQGRYYLVALFVLLVLTIEWARRRFVCLQSRWPRFPLLPTRFFIQLELRTLYRLRALAISIAAVLCIWAAMIAVRTVANNYWHL